MPKRCALFLTSLIFAVPALFSQAPVPQETALEKGWKAYKSADYPAALEAARQARLAGPTDPAAAELWGRAALASGDPAKAVPALAALGAQRGTLDDYRLLATAFAMAGRAKESEGALLKAESGRSPTAEGLYALASQKPDVATRLALLKRISKDFPAAASSLAAEISFWEPRGSQALRAPAAPLAADGVTVKLKTLFDAEWAIGTAASGEEIWLMVDTASRTTVLSRDTAARLKLPTFQAAFAPAGAYAGEAAPLCTLLDSVDLGGWKVQNVPAVVVDDAPGILNYREGRGVLKGILGMDVLAGLKVRYDRQKNVLRILPAGASAETLLDGKPGEWTEIPGFFVDGQVLVGSSLGTKAPVLGLLATGCTFVLASDAAIPGSGLSADSRNTVNLSFGTMAGPGDASSPFESSLPSGASTSPQAAPGVPSVKPQPLGWLGECLPAPGNVRTVPKGALVGMGQARFDIRDLPLYPAALGGSVPAPVVIGKKITDFFAIALDLGTGKVYTKQVLFAK